MVNKILEWSTIAHNLAIICLTGLLVMYTIKTYYNQKKQPYRLIARVDYCFTKRENNSIPVILDILNCGDCAAQMIQIKLNKENIPAIDLDRIDFIASKENFGFYLGELQNEKLILYNNDVVILDNPLDYKHFQIEINENVIKLTIWIKTILIGIFLTVLGIILGKYIG